MKQSQKAGNNSTNLQANTISISQNQGLDYQTVKQIALDIFRANFYELAGEAKEIAKKRAEEITDEFLKKLEEENSEGYHQANSPDFQYALFTVQKEYARNGDEDLGSLLVDLLIDRTKHDTRSIIQIVMNESLAVAPKLTSEQLAVLSIIFLFSYTINRTIVNQESFFQYLDKHVEPFSERLTKKSTCYQHLEYTGCGTISLLEKNLADIFKENYGGIFSKGFEEKAILERGISLQIGNPIFTPCLNDKTKIQINAMNVDVINNSCSKHGIDDGNKQKLISLYNETLMNNEEIISFIEKGRSYMKNIFDVFNNSSMNQFTLTSVGIAIGHANMKRLVGEFTNLSTWIN